MPISEYPRIKLDDLVEDFPGVFDAARHVDVGIGRPPLVRAFVSETLPHDPSLAVLEIKEKWGGMRIWCETPVLQARLATGKVEIKSGLTCEVCGAAELIRRPPPGRYAWWRCLCDNHASDDQKSWGTHGAGRMDGMLQCQGGWYRYDEITDAMLPTAPPEGWGR
ncbi:hypothetical protein EGT36_30225 [Agrobacterium sp. FDAARGOS_525]|uniref:hypothetical protein n=1 Tax=Agrobacterium sp. FDAARGOS_525 TaxID=2420311 RepID=UPI000F65BD00|nr:hypothetical protein [Agrobacterium sp. FDAARGOS_525]RSC21467.1 hypothetical protein EGT36_30225 [Agrobacterium sp. FDAARGOS_525]